MKVPTKTWPSEGLGLVTDKTKKKQKKKNNKPRLNLEPRQAPGRAVKKPAVAIKEKEVSSQPSTKYNRPVGAKETKLPPLINVRYLYQPGELEGGTKRATDPIWSLKVYQVVENKTKPNEPVVYYLSDGPKRGFVCEELLVVPPNTQLPPA